MTNPNNDLSSLFATPVEGSSQDVRYRQGTIVAWDPVTLANQIAVGTTILTNLPVLGIAEAVSYGVGDVVGLLVIGAADGRPTSTYAVIGQLVTPNTQAAIDAVSQLNQSIFSDFVAAGEATSSATYVDLATVGPQVNVPIGANGRILIIGTAQVQWSAGPALTTLAGGVFNIAMSGANTRVPNDPVDPLVGATAVQLVTATNNTQAPIFVCTAQATFSGLTPGLTNIKMVYRATSPSTPSFFRRGLVVFKL